MVDLIWKYKKALSLVALCLVVSCAKPSSTLTAKTREGRNTMAYRMTGSFGDSLVGGSFDQSRDELLWSADSILIRDDQRNKGYYHKSLSADKLDILFKYDTLLNQYVFEKTMMYNTGVNHQELSYIMDTSKVNFAEITYINDASKIVSGLFELNLIGVHKSSTEDLILGDTTRWLRLYDGRFDLKKSN